MTWSSFSCYYFYDVYYYVDKTLIIQALLDKGGDVHLFTRPRRFGNGRGDLFIRPISIRKPAIVIEVKKDCLTFLSGTVLSWF